MRRVLSFTIPRAILAAVICVVVEQVGWSQIVPGEWLLAAGFLVVLGAYWIWMTLKFKAEE